MLLFLIAFLIFSFFLPTFVLMGNDRKWGGMLVLNILLGWTGIGWIILMVLAISRVWNIGDTRVIRV